MTIEFHVHKHLIGKLCKLTDFGLILEKEYELLGFGNARSYERILFYNQLKDQNSISLISIDEYPHKINGVLLFCVKEIGKYSSGDWHWFSLNQLIICEES